MIVLKFKRRLKLLLLLAMLVVLVLKMWHNVFNCGQKTGGNDENPIDFSVFNSDRINIVESPYCTIPNLNPFDKSILKFVQSSNRTLCSSRPALTEVSYNPGTGEHRLNINMDAVNFYTQGSDLVCCVATIEPSGEKIRISQCHFFNGSWTLTTIHQFLFVRCSDLGLSPVYENIHATIIKSWRPNKESSSARSMNVLVLGFDSMSRLNFHRTMPKTLNYLLSLGWTEMNGYNKVADNTLPNLLALLAGLPIPGPEEKYLLDYFDKLPFIWKDFSSKGYVTAYVEDKPYLETFAGDLLGFKDPPTDYYARSLFWFSEKYFVNNYTGTECLGLNSPSELLFKYLLDFVRVHKDDKFFGLFWANHFSHNDLNKPASEDVNVLKLLRQLRSLGVMDTTMVVFLSDHGLRVGDLRKTKIGWYEDRLPFLFIGLPEWYKRLHAQRYRDLQENANKLVTPYDLYSTLHHVLQQDHWQVPTGCRTCHSVFTPLSPTRTCTEAGISPHWCTCHQSKDITDQRFAAILADLVVETLNAKLADYKRFVANIKSEKTKKFSCSPLLLSKVLYLRQKIKQKDFEYVVAVETYPGEGQFEATVVGDKRGVLVDDAISRLNHFNNQSHCALFPEMKKFCFCVENRY